MAVYKRDIVDINLETGNIHRSFLKHSIGYKDQKADHFGIRTYRDGVPVDLTGVSVQGIFLPPQGDPIAITSGNIVDGNVAEVVLPQACYNYDGQFTLSIKLVDSNNSVTGTMRIVDGMVDNTHASGTVAPTDAVPTYQEILAVYAQLLEDVTDYESVVATQDGKIDDLKSALDVDEGDIAFQKYSGSVENKQNIAIITNTATITTGKSIPKTGGDEDRTGYNIATLTAEYNKKYIITLQAGSSYKNIRAIELVKSNDVVAYVCFPKNETKLFLVQNFSGTIRMCYRAANTNSFRIVTCKEMETYTMQNDLSELEEEVDDILPISEEKTDFITHGINLCDPTRYINGKYLDWSSGDETDGTNYHITDYIPIIPGQYYTINRALQSCIYDESKQFIGGFYLSSSEFNYSNDLGDPQDWVTYTERFQPITILAQTGWAYLRVTFSNAYLSMIVNAQSIGHYDPYRTFIPYFSIPANQLIDLNTILIENSVAPVVNGNGIQIKLLGDSITAGVGGTGYDASSTGGGDKIANYGGGVYANVAGHCWANSIVSYWESKFNCTVKNYGWSGIPSAKIIEYWSQLVKAEDDIIICTIGTNDRADCATVSEFIDHLETIVDYAVRDGKQLILIANIPASVSNETNGTKNFHMEDVEHAIRYVTNKRSIPFMNLYRLFLDYCKYTNTTIDSLLNDGLHPNDAGYNVMFDLITNALGISPKRPDATW